MNFLFVGLGGALGAMLRYLTGNVVGSALGKIFPYGTLVANLAGAFLIGVLFVCLNKYSINENYNLLLVTGLLGGFTTFSSFTLDIAKLAQSGDYKLAILYFITTNVLGLLLVFSGIFLSSKLTN